MENYLWNYKFYRYLFKPQNLLKVSTQGSIELTQIESLTQLGHSQASEEPGKPGKKQKEPVPVQKTTQKPFTVTIQPLSKATLYVEPPKPTPEEQREQNIQQEVKQIEEEVKEEQPEAKVDIGKFRDLIALQVEKELESVRQKVFSELGGKKK